MVLVLLILYFPHVLWSVYLLALILPRIGGYKMAKHAGIPRPWLAFLPIVSGYVSGLLAERSCYFYTGRKRRLSLWLPISSAVYLVAPCVLWGIILGILYQKIFLGPAQQAVISVAVLALELVCFALKLYASYYLLKDYAPKHPLLLLVAGTILGISFVYLFALRNTVPVSVTGPGEYPEGRPKYDKRHRWSQTPPRQIGGPATERGEPA